MSPRGWLAALVFLTGCGRDKLHSTDGLYRRSEALWRHGEVQKAIAAADEGWRQWKNEPASEWHWQFRLLEAELLLNQGSVARALTLLEGAGGAPPPGELSARYLANLGHAKKDPALVDRALELALRQGNTALLAAIELKRANLDRYGNRSEAYIRSALAQARARSDTYLEAAALLDFGYQRLHTGRFDEAIPWLEQAESKARLAGADRVRERALGNIGWCYYRLGDFDRALHSLSDAVTLARQVDDDYLYRWLNDIGNIHYFRSDLGQAIHNYQDAADLARRAGNMPWLAVTLNNLAASSLEKGDIAGAERFNQQVRALIQGSPNPQSMLHSQLHTARIEVARKQPRAESSFRAVIDSAAKFREPFVRWEAQAGLARLLHERGRAGEADTAYRQALSTIEIEWSKLGEDRHKVTFLSQLISFYGDYIDFLMDRGEIERAAAVADSSRARVLAQKLDDEPDAERVAVRSASNGSLPVTRQYLLSYWVGPARSYLWVTGPRGFSHFILPGEARIASLVNRYNSAIEGGHDPLERDNPAGRELFRILVAPARSLIPLGASVTVVPDGSLHGLNFETLIVDDPKPHYWIEDVTLAVAPALDLLQAPRPRRPGPARLLFVGDPAPADPVFPPLPHLKREVEIVRRSYPGAALKLLTREAANPPAYRAANPGSYDRIHFAAHAVANAESPLNSAVVLSKSGDDYKLYAKDVIDHRLQADLVTISACRSAGARSFAGEGLIGFTWAFMQAGATNVVAGLWDADDEATVEIMAGFYHRLVSGARPGEALRLAKLNVLRSHRRYRKPYYWGALQLFTRELAGGSK